MDPGVYSRVWVLCALWFAALGLISAIVVDAEAFWKPPGFWYDIGLLSTIASGLVVALLLRRNAVLLVVLAFVLWLLSVFLSLGIPQNTVAPMLVLLGSVAAIPSVRDNRVAVLIATVLLLGFVFVPHPVAATYGHMVDGPSWIVRAVQVGPSATIVTMAIVFAERERALDNERRKARELEDMITELSKANIGFQQYAQDVEVRSKDEERKRITRDLHDSIGYMISAFTVMLDAAIGFLPRSPERSAEVLKRARDHADKTHQETRQALHALRSLEEAAAFGVKNILRIADSFGNATGVNVDVQLTNSAPSYGGVIDATLYRFVQEALVNAFRHGKARNIQVIFWTREDAVEVVVRDDGSGTVEFEEGIGFLGMRERLSQVQGELSHESLENGFRVAARIPLPRGAA